MTTYFDITDVIDHARQHSRVSGIQRVQVRIIQELMAGPNKASVAVVYFNRRSQQHVVIDAAKVLGAPGVEFQSLRVLNTLCEMPLGGLLPARFQVNDAVRRYADQKPLRAWMKARLYMKALVCPQRLIALGLEDWRGQGAADRTSTLTPLVLTAGDNLALLGSFWNSEPVVALARRHHEQGGRVAVLVHDVIPRVAPQYCSGQQAQVFWDHFQQLPQYASRFLAVSDFTRQDFVRSMGARVHPEAVKVVNLAHEFGHHPRIEDVTEPAWSASQGRHVLCVGTIEPRKNGVLLLKVWQALISQFGDATPDLVFCGKYGAYGRFQALLDQDPALARKVRVVSSPSDAQLVTLHRDALMAVFPSFYEGWGLPVGESAWLGKYCLASSATSVPEVLGNLIDYASPHDPQAWIDKISWLIRYPEQLRARTQAIRRAPLRTWAQTAQDMLMALEAPQAQQPVRVHVQRAA